MTSATYYAAHPQSPIVAPHPHDVLSGRGAGITKHPGNKRWRDLIHSNREKYTSLPRNQRPLVAEEIVRAVGSLTPPGRFLAKDVNTQQWYIIGDQKAIEKTAQAMRDSKKNSRSTSTSPVTTPTPTPSPSLVKPSLNRLNTEDSFFQRMEGFTFSAPDEKLERHSSTMLMMDLVGSSLHLLNNDDIAMKDEPKCSPSIQKPSMDRKSTFDAKIDDFTFCTPSPPPTRAESGCSFASFGMLPEEEFEMLEASNEMPTAMHRFGNITFNYDDSNLMTTTPSRHMSLMEPQTQQEEDLMMMALDDSMHCGYTKRTNMHAFHYSI